MTNEEVFEKIMWILDTREWILEKKGIDPAVRKGGVDMLKVLKYHGKLFEAIEVYNYFREEIAPQIVEEKTEYGEKVYDISKVDSDKWWLLLWKIAKAVAPYPYGIAASIVEEYAAQFTNPDIAFVADVEGDVVMTVPRNGGPRYLSRAEYEARQAEVESRGIVDWSQYKDIGESVRPNVSSYSAYIDEATDEASVEDVAQPTDSAFEMQSGTEAAMNNQMSAMDPSTEFSNGIGSSNESASPAATSSGGSSGSAATANGATGSGGVTGAGGVTTGKAKSAETKKLFEYVTDASKQAWEQVEKDAKKHLENVLKGTESFSQAFKSVWHDMANKTKDILRDTLVKKVQEMLQEQVLKPLEKFGKHLLNSVIGALTGEATGKATGKATGGPVEANTPYIVGEVGRELFIPNTSGTIIPNDKLTIGQAQPVTVNVINRTGVQATAKSQTSFDGQRYVVDVFLDAYARNVGGMRDTLAARR